MAGNFRGISQERKNNLAKFENYLVTLLAMSLATLHKRSVPVDL